MQLLELDLHNYKVHRKKHIDFEPGVVGIVGDNGSGKSSIISAICFLFTGEYDTARKDESITQGETEGWVRGKFLLNGKEGVLERHLTGSKVSLTYGDVKLNKFTEVNQLWNDLLQIDSTIFNNVIVAKQGEIQSLFSDETAVRERIFQKIFMVPPTEKLRTTIWDNYVKTAPPEKIEEDIQHLQTLQSSTAAERNRKLAIIDAKVYELGSENTLLCINDRLNFLKQCQLDLIKKPELDRQIEEFTTELDLGKDIISKIDTYLAEEPSIHDLKLDRDNRLAIKPVYERKLSIANEINKLSSSIDLEENKRKTKIAEDTDIAKANALENINKCNAELRSIVAEKMHLLSLKGHANCPTCHQSIPNRESYIQQLMDREVALTAELAKANNYHRGYSGESQQLWSEIGKVQGVVQRLQYLGEEYEKLRDVEFSQEEFNILGQQIDSVQSYIDGLAQYKTRQVELTAELRVLNEKKNNLAVYTGSATLEHELNIFTAAVARAKQLQGEIAVLQLDAGKLEHELALLGTRISASETNHAYNLKRKEYLDKLTAVHDIFGVSKFPRRLIDAYMSTVQTSLATYLEYFSLPYTVKVLDGFKIRLYAQDQRKPLPTVSGGQEMMVGICLRLALHKMFAQAFPIWIIDEGTTHLSESKKQNYFDLINELRKQKVINQIIIIDHDERLSTVVDQIVQL